MQTHVDTIPTIVGGAIAYDGCDRNLVEYTIPLLIVDCLLKVFCRLNIKIP
ncbi:MAG: hypothetical protein SAL70_26235 [Scytonema sp. PMC 1070.18]|nr:hypothetical protein [Scytonema sp. PMC 1070.18]